MPQTDPVVTVRCFAIPVNMRKNPDGGWLARISICMRPRVHGQAGSYQLVGAIEALHELPMVLRRLPMRVAISGLSDSKPLPMPPPLREHLWRWLPSSFVELQASEATAHGVRSMLNDDTPPGRYPRAQIARFMVGPAVASNQVQAMAITGMQVEGMYPQTMMASFGMGKRLVQAKLGEQIGAFFKTAPGAAGAALMRGGRRRRSQLESLAVLQKPDHPGIAAADPAAALDKLRAFHEIHEGAKNLLEIAHGSDTRIISIPEGKVGTIRPSQVHNKKILLTESAFPVEIDLPRPGSVSRTYKVRIRNVGGALRIKGAASHRMLGALQNRAMVNGTNREFIDFDVDAEVTFMRQGSDWAIAGPPVDVPIRAGQAGIMLEREEAQGVRILLPVLPASAACFKCVMCNRGGDMEVVSPSATGAARSVLRRIPEDLSGGALHASCQFEANHAIEASWDGVSWNLVPETQDDEFHRSISGLDSYPSLARAVGLTWDVELALTDAEATAVTASGELTLGAMAGNPAIALCIHPVAFEKQVLANGLIAFSPRPQDGVSQAMRTHYGFLDLSGCEASQVELDVPILTLDARFKSEAEAAAFKARAPAHVRSKDDSDRRAEFARKSFRPEDSRDVLPALSEAGIELTHSGWHLSHAAAARRARALEQSIVARFSQARAASGFSAAALAVGDVLYQEDLLRGGRFDVFDEGTRKWATLTDQESTIHYLKLYGPVVMQCADEGVITAGVTGISTTVRTDGSVEVVERGSDVIFRWTGFGVARPRPLTPTARGGDATHSVAGGLGLIAVPRRPIRSQQRQRLGHTHSLRARLVDIAGNSWSVEEAEWIIAHSAQPLVSPSLTVQRFQPARAPTLFVATPKGRQEVRVMVIRSYDIAGAAPHTYEIRCPRVGFELLHLIGVGDKLAPSAALAFYRSAHDRSVREAAELAGGAGPMRSAAPHMLQSEHIGLEDPHIRGAACWFLPGHERQQAGQADLGIGHATLAREKPVIAQYPSNPIPGGGRHPAGPVRIHLQSGARRETRVSGGEIVVWLPPGQSQQIMVSSALDPAAVGHFGLFNAAAQGQSDSDKTWMADRLAQGANPIVTPHAVLQVVHAVQRPVIQPKLFLAGAVRREFGKADATIDLRYLAHMPSTGRIDLEANWTEPEDAPAHRQWLSTDKNENIGYWAIDSAELDFRIDAREGGDLHNFVHHLADTRRRTIEYSLIGTSRFVEYFNYSRTGSGMQPTREPGMQAPPGDPYLNDIDFQRRSTSLRVAIPNSGEPPPFEIEYVIPQSMIAERYEFGGHLQSTDTTRSLRVYFRRPAFLTGEGEMLGLLVAPFSIGSARASRAPSAQDDSADAVSEMAEDPLSLSRPIVDVEQQQLTSKFFPAPDEPPRLVLRRPVDLGTRALASDRTTTVLGYTIHEIEGEDLLYADIAIAPTERAAPFLQLALVRYQPLSVEGAHVSNRAALAYVRPAADRSVTVRFERVNSNPFSIQRKMHITVIGPAALDDDGQINTRMTLTLSKRKSSSAGAMMETKIVEMPGAWLNRPACIARWSIVLDIRQQVFEDEGPADDTLRGHCVADISETKSIGGGTIPVWFTHFGVGVIHW